MVRITLPLISPGLAAAGVLSFMLAWNEFAIALFLVTNKAKTLPLAALGFYAEEGVFWGPMCVYGTIYLIPTVIFTLTIQKYIIKGMTLGAIK
jgi:multiple sugar transport system permease protein